MRLRAALGRCLPAVLLAKALSAVSAWAKIMLPDGPITRADLWSVPARDPDYPSFAEGWVRREGTFAQVDPAAEAREVKALVRLGIRPRIEESLLVLGTNATSQALDRPIRISLETVPAPPRSFTFDIGYRAYYPGMTFMLNE